MSKYHWKHGVIDQDKYRKRSSKREWTYREYHVQYTADVAHKDVKMYGDTNHTFSHRCVQHQQYTEHDLLYLSIFFYWIFFYILPDQILHVSAAI